MDGELLVAGVIIAAVVVAAHDILVRPPNRWGLHQFAFWLAAAGAVYVWMTGSGGVTMENIVLTGALLAFGAWLILRALLAIPALWRWVRG